MRNDLSPCTSLGVLVYWHIFGDKTLLVLPLHSKGASSAHLLIFNLDTDISLPGLEAVSPCRHRSQWSYLQCSGWLINVPMAGWGMFACVLFCTRCGNCYVFLSNTHAAVMDVKWVLKHCIKMAVFTFSSLPELWVMQCWELVACTLKGSCRCISGCVAAFLRGIFKLYVFCVCIVG